MSGDFKAGALHCVDGRFVETHARAIAELRDQFDGAWVDQLTNPGATAAILLEDDSTSGVFANFAGIENLHQIDTIVLIEHEDCGMYRFLAENGHEEFVVTPETEKAVHAENAYAAAEILKAEFPNMEFLFRYATLDGYIEDL